MESIEYKKKIKWVSYLMLKHGKNVFSPKHFKPKFWKPQGQINPRDKGIVTSSALFDIRVEKSDSVGNNLRTVHKPRGAFLTWIIYYLMQFLGVKWQ